MPFRFITSLALALAVLTSACGSGEPASPAGPERSLRVSDSHEEEIQEMIEELFPAGLETAALRQFRNVVRTMPLQPAAGQAMARGLTGFIWTHYTLGDLTEIPPAIDLTGALLEEIVVLADLGPSVRKSVENAVVATEGEATWYVEVTNPAGAPLPNVVLYDTLDSEISEFDVDVNDALFPGAIVTVDPGGHSFRVELGSLPPTAGVAPAVCMGLSAGYCLAYTVEEKEPSLDEGIYCNRVAIVPGGGLVQKDIACVEVVEVALRVRKTVDEAVPGPGDVSTWSVEVENSLVIPLTGVVIHDTLDASFSGFANVVPNAALFPLATVQTTADPRVFRVILPTVPPTGGAPPAGCGGLSAGFCLAYTVETTAPPSVGVYCNRITGEAKGGFRKSDIACISVEAP